MATDASSADAAIAHAQEQAKVGVTDPTMKRKIVFASTIGTTIEFYDFYVYATAAVAVFPYLFFAESDDQKMNLLKTFAIFGLAFIARPLGSLIFGHFGDKVGRKVTLVGSLLTMGIATFLIGCLPTYDQVGLWAPFWLAVMRFCQGLGLGGEWSGAALLASETAEKGKRAWAAMWPQLGAPFGFLLANGFFLLLTTFLDHSGGELDGDFMTWGWRLPFLASAVLVILGLWIRVSLEETPVFKAAVQSGQKAKTPLKEAFRTSWRPMILGTFIMLSCYTLFYLVTTWILSYGIADNEKGLGLGIAYTDFLKIQLIAIFGFMIGIPIAGRWADIRGRKTSLTVISFLIIAYGCSFAWALDINNSNETRVTFFLIIGMIIMGLIFGPMSAVLPELFPTNVRYTGSGISYNMASILGAAVAPFIATELASSHGVWAVGLYLIVAATITLIAVRLMPETKHYDLVDI